ncbi:MAG TPA: DJ-1/PfpI family protein [Terracidiphilus sp.]|nr:DJ-1/PfpI family protein [Terracidiphilus sp.]
MLQPANATIRIGIPLYPKFDSLDVLGPYQVFTYAPDVELHLVASNLDAVTSLENVRIMPEMTFASCPDLDVLLVPGASDLVSPLRAGPLGENELLDFLVKQAANAKLVCSVCTGALLLAAAGLLDGYTATTHWAHLETLALFPCKVAPGFPRYTKSENRVTSAGISSGIDASLFIVSLLRGDEAAMRCQLKMQYRPEPQFHAGDPADGDIWKFPLLPQQVKTDWAVAEVRKAYEKWLRA